MRKVAVMIDGGFLSKVYESWLVDHEFVKEGLDKKTILRKLFQKYYVLPGMVVNRNFQELDVEFKSWFSSYPADQFSKIESLLNRFLGKRIGGEITPDKVIEIAKSIISAGEELFRIYYYDCPPLNDKLLNPISNKIVDFAQTKTFTSGNAFQEELARREFIAFRKGEVRAFGWKLDDNVLDSLKNTNPPWTLEAKHLKPNIMQKGLDMRIGLDMAILSMKGIVDKVAVITGDTDFIPAMKHARKEGMLVAIVDIGGNLRSEMRHHADQVIICDFVKV